MQKARSQLLKAGVAPLKDYGLSWSPRSTLGVVPTTKCWPSTCLINPDSSDVNTIFGSERCSRSIKRRAHGSATNIRSSRIHHCPREDRRFWRLSYCANRAADLRWLAHFQHTPRIRSDTGLLPQYLDFVKVHSGILEAPFSRPPRSAPEGSASRMQRQPGEQLSPSAPPCLREHHENPRLLKRTGRTLRAASCILHLSSL